MTQNVGRGPASPANPQARASKLYQANSYHGFSKEQAMAEAFRVIISTLMLARDAYTARTLDVMIIHTTKALKIVDVLREELKGSRDGLNDPDGVTAADFLHQLYTEVIMRISDVLLAKDPAAEFNAIIERIKPTYKAWSDAAKPPSSAAAAKALEAMTIEAGS